MPPLYVRIYHLDESLVRNHAQIITKFPHHSPFPKQSQSKELKFPFQCKKQNSKFLPDSRISQPPAGHCFEPFSFTESREEGGKPCRLFSVYRYSLVMLEAFFPPGEVPLSVSQKFPSSNLQLPCREILLFTQSHRIPSPRLWSQTIGAAVTSYE